MMFTVAEYEAVIGRIVNGTDALAFRINQVGPAADFAARQWYVPQALADTIRSLGNYLIRIGSAVLDKIKELLVGASAPLGMFLVSSDWQDARSMASSVAADLNVNNDALQAQRVWQGGGATAYTSKIKPQADAADRIARIADKVSAALGQAALSGLAFYVAIGVILAKLIAAFVVALAAFGSAVFSPAGVAIIIEEAGVNTGLVIAAVSTLSAALGAQVNSMNMVRGEAADSTAFPNGTWPKAAASDIPGQFRPAPTGAAG